MHQCIILHLLTMTSFPTHREGLEQRFSWNYFNNNSFFHLPPTSSHLHPLQAENCDSNSRLVVYEDDNGKYRLEKVNVVVKHPL